MCQYIYIYFFSILGAFLIKQLFHSRLLEMRWLSTISYPTGDREIIVKYTNQERWKTRTYITYHLTRILRRFLVLPPPRRNPQFRIRMNVKKCYHFVLVFRKVSSDVWRLYLGEGSFTRIEVRTGVVCTHSFSFGIKTKKQKKQKQNKIKHYSALK